MTCGVSDPGSIVPLFCCMGPGSAEQRDRTMRSLSSGAHSRDLLASPGERCTASGTRAELALADGPVICPSGGLSTGVSSPLCKNISLHPSGKSSLQIRAIPPHKRGVSRSSRTRGADAVDAAASCAQRDGRAGDEPVSDRRHADERCCQRTAKSCGPDAPALASSSRRCVGPTGRGQNLNPLMTVAKEPVTGESTK
jgi:hypothetical protein